MRTQTHTALVKVANTVGAHEHGCTHAHKHSCFPSAPPFLAHQAPRHHIHLQWQTNTHNQLHTHTCHISESIQRSEPISVHHPLTPASTETSFDAQAVGAVMATVRHGGPDICQGAHHHGLRGADGALRAVLAGPVADIVQCRYPSSIGCLFDCGFKAGQYS